MNPDMNYDKISRIFDERRLRNNHIHNMRKEEVYDAIPEYRQLDKSLADLACADIEAIIAGDKSALTCTRSSLKETEEKKRKLLTDAGFPADYLDMIYTCKDCKDTGFIGAGKCHCFKSELLKILYKQSNLDHILERENFSTFDINYYSDDYLIPNSDITPRENIKRVLETCKYFIKNFDSEHSNMLIYGNSGVGKTFLTNCMAKEILDMGYSVIYLTSYQLFDILETKVFRPNDSDELKEGISSMLGDCDLLIIDDLGTEMINKFTEVQLFNCIQNRLRNEKSTIISTNLSFDDLTSNYSERIFSRLIGHYKLIKLYCDDIRIKNALK